MAVVDCFPFFNELDLLEIRLHSLAPFVDRFVLCEMETTHSGKPKPLFFASNKSRFSQFPITHLIAPTPPPPWDPWRLEHYQREYLMQGLQTSHPDDTILLSDLDEIPDLTHYTPGSEGAFKQRLYYYYFNVFTGDRRWKGTLATKYRNIPSLNYLRNRRNHIPTIVSPGGWHFSTLAPASNIIYKIESFAHVELDRPEFKSNIPSRMETLHDPYDRGAANWGERGVRLEVEEPSGPEWLLANRDRYPHLWYPNTAGG